MKEKEIEDHLIQSIKNLGGECRKVKWIGRKGAPDRVALLNGQTIWIELKRPGANPEPHQQREHQRMRQHGQRVEVIDTIESIAELLK